MILPLNQQNSYTYTLYRHCAIQYYAVPEYCAVQNRKEDVMDESSVMIFPDGISGLWVVGYKLEPT